jgi:hypothetical protein
MKTYHMAHHYKNYEMGFGVTSELIRLSNSLASFFADPGPFVLQASFGITFLGRSWLGSD